MIPLISICGCGHTGSSILARILGSHSSIYFVKIESGMFLANRYFKHSNFYDDYQRQAFANHKSFILEKTPRHIWHVDYIRRVYPSTKFILTTRNCYDVVASLYARTKDFKGSLMRFQDDSILTLRQLSEPDTLLVKHEDLLSDPAYLLDSLCSWLNIPYESDMLNYSEKPISWNLENPYSSGVDAHDRLRNEQVNSPLKKSSTTWEERLPLEHHQELIDFFSEGSMGHDIIKSLGY